MIDHSFSSLRDYPECDAIRSVYLSGMNGLRVYRSLGSAFIAMMYLPEAARSINSGLSRALQANGHVFAFFLFFQPMEERRRIFSWLWRLVIPCRLLRFRYSGLTWSWRFLSLLNRLNPALWQEVRGRGVNRFFSVHCRCQHLCAVAGGVGDVSHKMSYERRGNSVTVPG